MSPINKSLICVNMLLYVKKMELFCIKHHSALKYVKRRVNHFKIDILFHFININESLVTSMSACNEFEL